MLPVGKRRVIISNFIDCNSQQNNGAELLAMVFALRVSIINKDIKIIASDSSLVVDYWSVKGTTKTNICSRKKGFIDMCVRLRKEFESNGGKIIKISGDDNPADLGYHKK